MAARIFLYRAQQQALQQVHRQLFGEAAAGIMGLLDAGEQAVELGAQRLIEMQPPDAFARVLPLQPVVPVGARTEVDPAVMPLRAVRGAPVVVRRFGLKQQHIARQAVKAVFAVEHPALAFNGEV